MLYYSYFKDYYKLIAINLGKQQALDADPKAMQQISVTINLDRNGNRVMFFIIEEAKETMLNFSERTAKVLNIYFALTYYKMTQYNLSIEFESNIIGDDKTNFSQKWLLTNTQVSKIRQAFANGLTANIKFSKTQISMMARLGGLLPFSLINFLLDMDGMAEKIGEILNENEISFRNYLHQLSSISFRNYQK